MRAIKPTKWDWATAIGLILFSFMPDLWLPCRLVLTTFGGVGIGMHTIEYKFWLRDRLIDDLRLVKEDKTP